MNSKVSAPSFQSFNIQRGWSGNRRKPLPERHLAETGREIGKFNGEIKPMNGGSLATQIPLAVK